MKTYAVIIIDDEPIARAILEKYVLQSPQLTLAGSVDTLAALKEILVQQPADFLLLDIHLKEENSLRSLRWISGLPKIIFVTANKEYAAESYELEAIDYLLKPVSPDRFRKAIEKFIRLENGDAGIHPEEKSLASRLYFKTTTGFVSLLKEDILYCEAKRDYAKIVLPSKALLVNTTMKALEEKLCVYPEFIRIHKSYLINKTYVQFHDRHHLQIGDIKLPVGESFRKTFLQRWAE